MVGTVPWYPEMRNHRVAQGRFFTETDMDGKASVCVLGAEMVPALFPLESPLGKHIRVGANYYQVIGVMEPRGTDVKNEETSDAADNKTVGK
jgi:putative ABC transport system permease protein